MLGELVQVFVDDLVIKGPRSDYDNKKLEGTNLRLWFLEYLRTYAIVLRRYQHAGLTLSGEKFVAITPRISITGIVVDRHGKHSDPVKVAKLEDWPCPPPNISSLRGFLGLANYLRPFIKNFAVIDAPLRKLLTGRFRWNDDATVAMEQLKQAAKQQPILVAIDYSSSEPLVLAVDSSQIAAGWALYQGDAEEGQLRKLNQYGSVGFSEVESRYSQPQLELCGVFKAVKQLRHSLYGTFFILEVDAASLRQMINSPDIPNAAMTRWVQYLKLFNHQIRHVPGRHHTLPDGLSRTDFDTVEPAEDSMDDKIGLEARALGIGSADTTSSSGETKQDQQTSTDQEEEKVFGKAHYTTMGNDRRRRVSKDGSIKGNHEMGSDSQRRAAVSKEEESKSDHDGQARDGDLQGQTAKASYTHITPTTTGTLGADIIDWRRRATEGTSRIDDRNGESQGRPAVSEEEGNGIARETDDLRRQTVGIPAHLGQTPEDTNLPPEGIDTPEGTDSEDSDDFLTSCDTAPDDTSSDSSTEDPANPAPLQRTLYSDKWLHLAEYLHSGLSFQVLKPLAPSRRQWVKNQIGKFFVRGGRLYRRGKRDIPLLVIDTEDLKQKLLHEAHEQHGHRGRDATVSLLLKRVWWEKLAVDCLRHVLSCDPCQRRQQRMHREPARHAPIPNLFERFNMDIVDLGQGVGPKRYLVVARDALTGWPEARLLSDKTSASVRTFLEEDVFSRYGGTICTILTDNGPENSGETKFIVKHLGFKHAFSTQYNPEGNTEVERGHGPLVEGMLRASYDDRANIAAYLPYALWADRITTRRTTSYSPFELVYGMDPIIPMDIELSTFVLFDWDRIQSTTDLIAARTRQLKRRMDDLHLAKLRLEYSRQQGRTYADTRNSHLLRDPLPPGSLVIVSNPKHDQRAEDRWFGPYRVTRQLPGGSYALTELNGTPMDRNYAAKHVRQYFSRSVPLQTLQDNTIRTGSHPAGPSQQDDGTRLVIDAPSRVPTSTTSAAPERLPPLAPPAAPAVPLKDVGQI
ncbi:hypothetical protein CF326_g7827 [Tilletia indica]|nr:hypothetical protein CF326_g7827 [Tilletia indica]